MPRAPRPKPTPMERLTALPRRAGFTVEGGMRTLPTYVLKGREMIQPRIVLWLDAASGAVLSVGLLEPAAAGAEGEAAAQVLVTALTEAAPSVAVAGDGPSGAGGAGKGKRAAARSRAAPALPDRVLVNDEGVAGAARALLEPLAVTVEHRADLPAFDAALQSLVESMGLDPNAPPPQPFSWDVDEALLPPLFKAAAGLWRRAPWDNLLDHPPIAVALGDNGPAAGVDTLYVSVLGAMGEVYGVACYFSAEDYRAAIAEGTARATPSEEQMAEVAETMAQMGLPMDAMPPGVRDALIRESFVELGPSPDDGDPIGRQNSLALLFDAADEVDPTYRLWLDDHKLKAPSKQAIPSFLRASSDAAPRRPDTREARALTLALEALNHFFSRYGRSLEPLAEDAGAVTHTVELEREEGKIPVTLTYPASGFSLDKAMFDPMGMLAETPERPAPADAKTTLYRFKVELKEGLGPGYGYGEYADIWRRIELRGDQKLHDLHLAIQKAFKFDNDHLYAFFLSNRAWDQKSEYASPFSEGERDSMYPLATLPLRPRKRFLYLFDYGDDWRFTVTLEGVTSGGVEKRVRYPRVTESHGAAPPQYPEVDDEDEEDDEE